MRRTKVLKLSVTALCIALNMIGGTIALWLKLPVYLDSVGTILAGGLLGPPGWGARFSVDLPRMSMLCILCLWGQSRVSWQGYCSENHFSEGLRWCWGLQY